MKTYKHTNHNTGKVTTYRDRRKPQTFGQVREANARRNRDRRLLDKIK